MMPVISPRRIGRRLIGAAAVVWLTFAGCVPCPDAVALEQVFLLDPTFEASAEGDCTPAAAGCAPGGPCLAACECVVAREQIPGVESVDSCTLLAGGGPPAVEMRSHQNPWCPGD